MTVKWISGELKKQKQKHVNKRGSWWSSGDCILKMQPENRIGGQINIAHIVRASPLDSACSQKKSQWKNIWIRFCSDETENILNSRKKRHVQAVMNCHSYNSM